MSGRRLLTISMAGAAAVAATLWFAPPEPLVALLFGGTEAALPVDRMKKDSETVVAAPADIVLSINPLRDLAIDQLSEFVDRPLFNPSRAGRPPVVELEPPPEQPQPAVAVNTVSPADFMLLAVAGEEQSRVAVLRWMSKNQTFRLRAGQYISNWQITAIEPREVSLQLDESVVTLRLFDGTSAPRQAEPAAGDSAQDQSDEDE